MKITALDKAMIRLLIFSFALLLIIWIFSELNIGELILLGYGCCGLLFLIVGLSIVLLKFKK